MRRVALLAMVSGALGLGVQFAVDGRWQMGLVCLLAGGIWMVPAPYHQRRATVGLLVLVGAGVAGVFLDYSPVWLLTQFVLLVIAWDLDHFTRLLEPFTHDHLREKEVTGQFYAHLRRLGGVAGAAWVLGMVALTVRISTSFVVTLILGLMMFFGLRGLMRLSGQREDSGTE